MFSERMCSSRKNPYPSHGRSLEIPRGEGGGVLEAKFLEAMYENKLELSGERGENGYFLELHNMCRPIKTNRLGIPNNVPFLYKILKCLKKSKHYPRGLTATGKQKDFSKTK